MYLLVLLLSILVLDLLPVFASISFTNQASTAGVADPGQSNGAAFGDYDGDGWPDLLVLPLGQNAPTRLYRNQGDGRFADQSEALSSTGQAASRTFVDYDGDGDLDIYVLYFLKSNQLFRNDDGVFTQISLPDSLSETPGAVSAAFGDFDEDGVVDLFTTYSSSIANQFYSHLYVEGFADQSLLISSLRSGQDSFSAVPFDYDNDGDLDLFVTNTGNINLLHRNEGRGVFQQVAEVLEVHHPGSSIAAFPADYDNDGDLDLYMINVGEESNILYRNERGERFVDVTAPAGLTDSRSSLGAAWVDFDNDGDLDLIASNIGRPLVFENHGDGTFADITASALQNMEWEMVLAGVAVADYDLDGDVDIFLSAIDVPDLLLRNDSAAKGHWLGVRLQVRGSKQTALGARVVVKTPAGVQMREYVIAMAIGTSYGNLLHFGLGSHGQADEVVIEWPSGQRQILKDVVADQVITVKEPLPVEDLRIGSVVRPDLAPLWESLVPEVEVRNVGQSRMRGAVLQAQIASADRSMYSVSRPVPELAAGASARIRFPVWTPEIGGMHKFSFALDIDDDLRANNTWERTYNLYPFKDVAPELGVDDPGSGWAGAFADYDNDGDLDMYISNGGAVGQGGNVLYRNDLEQGFTDVTLESGVGDGGNGTGLTFADFDRDGLQDLFIDKGGFLSGGEPNHLFHNNGDATFSDVSTQAGLDVQLSSYGVAVGDYDQDGYIDLFVSQLRGQPNTLYHNEGDGTFADVSQDRNIVSSVNFGGSASVFADYDNDGDLDLCASIFGGSDIFYLAVGDTTFSVNLVGNEGGQVLFLVETVQAPFVPQADRAWGCRFNSV